nr:MAG TPA: hypothetical protein [Caudoviricetes sp.]
MSSLETRGVTENLPDFYYLIGIKNIVIGWVG